jgi:hypothetical protein
LTGSRVPQRWQMKQPSEGLIVGVMAWAWVTKLLSTISPFGRVRSQ